MINKEVYTEESLKIINTIKNNNKVQKTLNDFIELFPSCSTEKGSPLTEEQLNPPKKTYTQNWQGYNLGATNEKLLSIQILRDILDHMKIRQTTPRKKSFTIEEKVLMLFLKTYNNISSRRFVSDMVMARGAGYISKVVHFNSITNYFRDKELTPVLKTILGLTTTPLMGYDQTFAVDSSGIGLQIYQRWQDIRAEPNSKKKMWRKLHILIGCSTGIILSGIVTDAYVHDSKYFPKLLLDAKELADIEIITADMAYLSREHFKLCQDMGILPFVPFRKGITGAPKGVRIWRLMHDLFKSDQESFMRIYHRRSIVESRFSSLKKKFGTFVRSRDAVSQENSIMMMCIASNLSLLCHSIFEAGVAVDFTKSAQN